jgi:hypothetical protein
MHQILQCALANKRLQAYREAQQEDRLQFICAVDCNVTDTFTRRAHS